MQAHTYTYAGWSVCEGTDRAGASNKEHPGDTQPGINTLAEPSLDTRSLEVWPLTSAELEEWGV